MQNHRALLVPNINFQASAYYEMIDWKGDYTEPPLTKRIGDDDTATYIQTGEGDLPKLTSVNLASHMHNEYTLSHKFIFDLQG